MENKKPSIFNAEINGKGQELLLKRKAEKPTRGLSAITNTLLKELAELLEKQK